MLTRPDQRNISSLVVTDHIGRPMGLVMDRDVLREIARRGASALHLPARTVMRSPAPTCRLEDTLTQIMRRMTHDRIRHLIVLDELRLIGIVSIGDLMKSKLLDADLENRVLRDRALGRLAPE